jgi:hypothetical protein
VDRVELLINMTRRRIRQQGLLAGLFSLVCLVVFGLAIQTTNAGSLPSSLSPDIPIKAAVYQGVVVIAPTTTNVIELGNAGRDIAGNGDLYLRPNGLTEAQGARFVASGGVTDLYVGSLCLYGSGSEVCQSGIPSGGSDTFWQSIAQSGGYETLQPGSNRVSLQIGTSSAPIAGTAIEVHANSVAPAVIIDGTFETGIFDSLNITYSGSGRVQINGVFEINNPTFTFSEPALALNITETTGVFAGGTYTHFPWNSYYQGKGTGLDADMFDSTTSVLFSTASNKDMFWKDIIASQTQSYKVLCLHTDATSLCADTTGANAGKICTTDAECGGAAGSCKRLCATTNAMCGGGATATRTISVAGSSCTTVNEFVACDAYCSGSSAPVICDGNTPPPGMNCSSTVGGTVRTDESVFGAATCNPATSNPVSVTCTCRLSTSKPYLQNTGYGGGDLCTDVLSR